MRPPSWTIELRPATRTVLVAGLRPPIEPITQPLTTQRWRETLDEVAAHRLDGLLVAAVADGSLPTTPEQRAEVARLEVELTRHQLWHDHHLAEIGGRLEQEGIEHRVLKGPAVGALDYPDRLMRPTSDFDLLIRGDDLQRAVTLLLGTDGVLVDPDPVPGFSVEVGKSKTIRLPGGIEIDLHRLLCRGPLGLRVVTDELWYDPRSFTVADVPYSTLGREASLLHSCLHLMILSDRRALSLRDVASQLASPDLDAASVLDLTRRWRLEIVLAAAILQADRHLGPARGPAGAHLTVWANDLRPRTIDRFYLRIARPDDPIGPAEWPATFIALGSMRARMLLLRSIITPLEHTNPPLLRRLRSVVRRSIRRTRPPG